MPLMSEGTNRGRGAQLFGLPSSSARSVLIPPYMNTANNMNRGYGGPERRRHRVFVTRNSEYHCRDGVCVAVRDCGTGEFLRSHSAIGRCMSAGVKFNHDGGIESISAPTEPHVGEQLCFSAGNSDNPRDVITSPLKAIERPAAELVERYPN